jgi:tetratricopeptide (TPR) repeat protein
LLLTGHADEAEEQLRIAVELDPDSPMGHHYLGTALFQTEKWEKAAKEFQEAVRLQPSADNHFYLAACLASMGNYDKALSEFDAASRLAPNQILYRSRKEELLKLMKQNTQFGESAGKSVSSGLAAK